MSKLKQPSCSVDRAYITSDFSDFDLDPQKLVNIVLQGYTQQHLY